MKKASFERGTASNFFCRIMHHGRNSKYVYGEADVWADYLSERLWMDSEKCMADFLGLSVKNEQERKTSRKSNAIKTDLHRKRPKSKSTKIGRTMGGSSSFNYLKHDRCTLQNSCHFLLVEGTAISRLAFVSQYWPLLSPSRCGRRCDHRC